MAAQVTTRRMYNFMSGGQALMRSVYYSRQASSKFLSSKQREVFAFFHTGVSSRGASVAEETPTSLDSTGATAPVSNDTTETSNTTLERTYGEVQNDPHSVAEGAHVEWSNKTEEDSESLDSTGFDMSKVSRPSGDE